MESIKVYFAPDHLLCLGIYWDTDAVLCWETKITICLLGLVVQVVADWEELFNYRKHYWWIVDAYVTRKPHSYELPPVPDDDDIPF